MTDPVTDAITHAAWQAANELGVDAIVCSTRSGRTARAMARFRPATELLGMSPDPHTVRTLCLVWGVTPMEVATYDSTDNLVWHTVEKAAQSHLVDTRALRAGARRRARAAGLGGHRRAAHRQAGLARPERLGSATAGGRIGRGRR